MGLAFWRSKKPAGNSAAKLASRPPQSHDDDADPRLDPAAALRTRARHRLIGAAALLLAVAIVVPMVLDPEPKPIAENIPIDIPSERTPFTPRLSLPPVPAPDNVPLAPPPDQPPAAEAPKGDGKAAAKSESKTAPKVEARVAAKTEAKPDDDKAVKAAERELAIKAEEQQARAALEGKDSTAALPAPNKAGKFAVQAAAPASEKSARDLGERLKKSGYVAFTEKVDTKDGARFRVRVGPYATREDAERVRARLKTQGISGNVVSL